MQLEPDVYRLRVGDYRVICKVLDEERIILTGRIVRRSESTYRDLRRLFE
ncbi:MAG: type II toxin-antitoxin system RelE/ParE family toxin [Anaerolineae bacterium]